MTSKKHCFLKRIFLSIFLLSLIATIVDLSWAEMYRYQKNGVWYYTDTPTREMPKDKEAMTESAPREDATLVGQPLLVDYPARNDIEKAVAATVGVKSAIGSGTGFFISTNGHIITNKHVLRTLEKQSDRTENNIERGNQQIKYYDEQFEIERKRLKEYKSRLDNLKRKADRESDLERRRAYEKDYEIYSQKYKLQQKRLEQQQKAYEKKKKEFRSGSTDYRYKKSVSKLSQSFTITLADNTQKYVHLVAVSNSHDLALLKLKGYTTPALTPGNSRSTAQSNKVYAIGNPVGLKNSVSSGVFGGLEGGFIKTNADIYPGNSGGPLVNSKGQVLGINTFKKITHKFEGLGFAIPIETALREFSAHLPAN